MFRLSPYSTSLGCNQHFALPMHSCAYTLCLEFEDISSGFLAELMLRSNLAKIPSEEGCF